MHLLAKPLQSGTNMPKVKYLETIPTVQPVRGKSQLVKMEMSKKHSSNFPSRYAKDADPLR